MNKNFLSFAERVVSGRVESRPYAEMRNFKVTKRLRNIGRTVVFITTGRPILRSLHKGIVRGTVVNRSARPQPYQNNALIKAGSLPLS